MLINQILVQSPCIKCFIYQYFIIVICVSFACQLSSAPTAMTMRFRRLTSLENAATTRTFFFCWGGNIFLLLGRWPSWYFLTRLLNADMCYTFMSKFWNWLIGWLVLTGVSWQGYAQKEGAFGRGTLDSAHAYFLSILFGTILSSSFRPSSGCHSCCCACCCLTSCYCGIYYCETDYVIARRRYLP